jgi:hypothetical protein
MLLHGVVVCLVWLLWNVLLEPRCLRGCCGYLPVAAYTVEKAIDFPVPTLQPGCHELNSPWPGIIKLLKVSADPSSPDPERFFWEERVGPHISEQSVRHHSFKTEDDYLHGS